MPAADAVDPLFLSFQLAVAGRYSLDREIGRGGMGVVYLAREVRLDRPVAIKLLPPQHARDAALRDRFVREARLAANLSHPNIIPIHSVDEAGEFVFYVMAFVDGETLGDRVAHRGPLSASEGTRVLRDVALALAHAHERGIVHRDVKPDNVLLERSTGRVLVADFGIAAATHGRAGDVAGTPEFMSPEQALGQELDGRSDVYSLGATAYYVLSGRLPFEGGSATEMVAKHVTQAPEPLGSMGTSVSRKVATLVDRCLAKNPAERPRTAQVVAERLAVALEQRRELPVALQAFVREHGRLGGRGALLSQLGLLGVALAVAPVAGAPAAYATLIGGYVVGAFGRLVYGARRLLQAGFRQTDLPAAFKAEIELANESRNMQESESLWRARRPRQSDRAVAKGPPGAPRLIRIWASGQEDSESPLALIDRTAGAAVRIGVVTSVLSAFLSVAPWARLFRIHLIFRGIPGMTTATIAIILSFAVGAGLLALAGTAHYGRLLVARLRKHGGERDDNADHWAALDRVLRRISASAGRIGIGVAAVGTVSRALALIWFLISRLSLWNPSRYIPPFIGLSIAAGVPFIVAGLIYGGRFLFGGGIRGLRPGSWAHVLVGNTADRDTEFWEKLWTGPIGRMAFVDAERFAPKALMHSAMTHRPTELSLGMAAESLFAALPKETRRHLAQVPAVIAQLQADAVRSRRWLDDLDDALSIAPDSSVGEYPELRARRDAAQATFQSVIEALENLRLSLLRLHAGSATVESFTTDLGSAAEANLEVERLLAAHQEIDREFRNLPDSRIATPV